MERSSALLVINWQLFYLNYYELLWNKELHVHYEDVKVHMNWWLLLNQQPQESKISVLKALLVRGVYSWHEVRISVDTHSGCNWAQTFLSAWYAKSWCLIYLCAPVLYASHASATVFYVFQLTKLWIQGDWKVNFTGNIHIYWCHIREVFKNPSYGKCPWWGGYPPFPVSFFC